MRFETYTFKIADHWVGALEYGDYSGLDDSEVDTLESFVASLPRGYGHWSWQDDAGFCRDDVGGLFSDCINAEYLVSQGV